MQFDTDIFITIVQGAITLLIAAEAFVVNTEPEVALRHRRAFEWTFGALCLSLFGLICWQGARNLDARRQGDLERQKFAQERRDSTAAFDRANQDSQIERNRLEGKVGNLSSIVKFVADTVRAQTLNGQKLNAQVSQNGGVKQVAELNNTPPLPAVTASEQPSITPPTNPDQITPKHLAFTTQPVLSNGTVVSNLFFFQSAVEPTDPDKDAVLSWDFGDGKPVTSRATERVLHAFSDEHPYRPGKIQVTVIGMVPRK